MGVRARARELSVLPRERRGLPATPVQVWPGPAGRRHARARSDLFGAWVK
jgi:hypothetical protein